MVVAVQDKSIRYALALTTLLLLAYAVVLVRTAWMCDDAFITLRTVDNFVQGYGLVWNVGERVQAYTHPLWMFLLSAFYAFTREPYFTTLAISMTLSLATVALLLWVSRHHLFTLLLVGVILIGSKAFADYSTSGLENPLAHLLLVLFFILCLRQPLNPSHAPLLGILAGLIMLNRLDHGLLVVPALLVTALQLPRRRAFIMLAAASALVASWLLFSLIYYGFPFPNTFYAKQTTGIPRIEYLERGVGYLVDTAVVDGVTLFAIVLAVGLALWRRRPFTLLAAAAGILLHVLYVIWIGGDFMGGRMFSAPLVASLTLLAAVEPSGRRAVAWVAVLLFALGLIVLNRPYLTSAEPLRGTFTGSIETTLLGKPALLGVFSIEDERQLFAQLWLLPIIQGKHEPTLFRTARSGLRWRENNGYFNVRGDIGMFGYYAGQRVYIVDLFALSDAFLARVKHNSVPNNWRIGHIFRPIPKGYINTKFTGKNSIADQELKDFYKKIQLITEGKIFSIERLSAIIDLNIKTTSLQVNNELTSEFFGRTVFNPYGLTVEEDLNLIHGIPMIGNHRLFFRAEGSYNIKLMSERGSTILDEHKIIAHDDKIFTYWFTLNDSTDSITFTPLRNTNSTIYFIVVTPRLSREPDILRSDFVTLNLYIPPAAGFTEIDLEHEPLWLKTHKRSIPMFLKAAHKVPHILEVKAIPVCPPGKTQTVALWLNGQRLAEHTWTDCSQAWEAEILIPADQLLEGWNLLEAEAEHGVVLAEVFPGSDDRRTLFVAFHRLWVRPAR
jgi:arabinofuranosyltransferase